MAVTPQPTLTITGQTRPVRSVILVNPEQTSRAELNHIVRFSCRIWGGRFHAIVPTDGLSISPNWWDAILVCDPDRICSMVELSPALEGRIHRFIAPASLVVPKAEEKDRLQPNHFVNYWRPEVLGIEGVPGELWRSRRLHLEPDIHCLIDWKQDGDQYDFVLRNFGALEEVVSVTEAFRDVPHTLTRLKDTDALAAMSAVVAKEGRGVTLTFPPK